MAVMWTGGVITYGWGANALGRLGTDFGLVYVAVILITTTVLCGLFTHEWDDVRGQPIRLLWVGIALLVAGMFV